MDFWVGTSLESRFLNLLSILCQFVIQESKQFTKIWRSVFYPFNNTWKQYVDHQMVLQIPNPISLWCPKIVVLFELFSVHRMIFWIWNSVYHSVNSSKKKWPSRKEVGNLKQERGQIFFGIYRRREVKRKLFWGGVCQKIR